jgi:hypothetical protein
MGRRVVKGGTGKGLRGFLGEAQEAQEEVLLASLDLSMARLVRGRGEARLSQRMGGDD